MKKRLFRMLAILIAPTAGVADEPATEPLVVADDAYQRVFEDRLGPHEPVYFIYGNEPQAAKFQFSFKYRLLGKTARLWREVPALRGLFFGFTQRSLWDIRGNSSPFYDTSYMPELMIETQEFLSRDSTKRFHWLGYQFGLRHESNGRSGEFSRSLNRVYVRPGVSFGRIGGWNVVLAPRIFAYVGDLENNPDIEDYRGHVEFMAVVAHGDGPSLMLTGRAGRGRGSFQADLTLPVRVDYLADFATYFLFQYWDGYGESLLDYDRRSTAFRAGFSLVR